MAKNIVLHESFEVRGDVLLRAVQPMGRKCVPTVQCCHRRAFMSVLNTVEQLRAKPFSLIQVRRSTREPKAQVITALTFLRRQRCIEPVQPGRYAVTPIFVRADALAKWHAARVEVHVNGA